MNASTELNRVSVREIQQMLRARGLRATPQRLAVGRMVLAGPVHVTAREVWQALREEHPAISLNTIYQTLGQFEASGLLQRLEVGGATIFDSNVEPHDHAFCSRCRAIVDLPVRTEATAPPPELAGWRVSGARRVWLGVCPRCKDRPDGNGPRPVS